MLGVLRWQWHQLDHMQAICTSLQTDNYTKTSLNFYSPDALLDAAHSISTLKAVLEYCVTRFCFFCTGTYAKRCLYVKFL